MATYLDFDSTKNFRDKVLSKNLLPQNGPQTYNSNNYSYSSFNNYSVIDSGDVTPDKNLQLLDNKTPIQVIQGSNTYKPLTYLVNESFSVLPRKANLSLYPYFKTNVDHSLINIITGENFDSESDLFKFSAKYIKDDENGPLQTRIKQNLYTETYGKVRILDAFNGNTATLSNIITGKEPLIELENSITVLLTPIGKKIEFTDAILGITKPFTEIPGNYLTQPLNPAQNLIKTGVDSVGELVGINNLSSIIKPSELFLNYMGSGQKKMLFDNLSYSKYSPNYIDLCQPFTSIMLGSPYIGDDRYNDITSTMSDNKQRYVRSPYYLSLLFDEESAKLFKYNKNISNGGSIAGNLTWYTDKSRNKIGLYNKEFNSESSQYYDTLSNKYNFKENSILSVTQDLLNTMPTDSSMRSHVANAIDQTSRFFRDGSDSISKGSAIKYTNMYNQEESGIEYCRVWTKDRSYLNYSDTMRRTGLIRKYESSILSTPWNLNIAPISNGNKSFDESTNIENYADGFRAKKYMFSIENLAWRTSNKPEYTYEDLPYCERGPNGGRIMWFPPYGVEISEQNNVSWEENGFIGRPEPIFTYKSATRSANLKFKIIVDHPSVLNLLVREHFKNMSDEEADNYISAFFAGCEELDFYDLIKRYATLSANDVENILAYLNQGKDPETIKKLKPRIDDVTSYQPEQNSVASTDIDTTLYFNNDIPGKISESMPLYSSTDYGTLFANYLASKESYINDLRTELETFKTKTWSKTTYDKDYYILTGKQVTSKPSDEEINSMIVNVINQINAGFDEAQKEFDDLTSQLNDLKTKINSGKIKNVNLTMFSSTSAVASMNYNIKLSYRRSDSVIKYILKMLTNSGSTPDLKWDKYITNDVTKEQTEYYKKNVSVSFSDLGYKYDGVINIIFVTNAGENVKNKTLNRSTSIAENKNVSCGDESEPTTKTLKTTIPAAFWCRESTSILSYYETETIPQTLPTSKVVIDEYETPVKAKPTIDVLKKIVMKVLGECYYFKKLEESSPLQFSSLKDKLKYFHPAFHSMTPEGLNTRLTFLHQCIRPGDTIPVKGLTDMSDLNPRNTSFGPPPIVILRFGDFYHTKAVIREYQISYDNNLWDLNSEGIGVQPMIADVTLQLSFFGGQGMKKPVDELQNALSSNFYANTEVYDYRATATEDRTKFNKEILENILSSSPKTSNLTTNDMPSTVNVKQGEFIGTFDSTNKTFSYKSLVSDLYNNSKSYIGTYFDFVKNNEKKYGRKILSLIFSEKYRKTYEYSVYNRSKIKMVGEYVNTDLSTLLQNLRSYLYKNIDSKDIADLLKLGLKSSEREIFNENIRVNLKKYVDKSIEEISNSFNNSNILGKRNDVINTLDRLNFLYRYSDDGFIDKNYDSTGYSLSGFSSSIFYNEYSQVISFINDRYIDISLVFDNSVDFLNIDDNYFLELLESLVFSNKSNNNEIIYLIKNLNNPVLSKNTSLITKLEKTFNSILESTNVYSDSNYIFNDIEGKLNYPVQSTSSLLYNINSEKVFTSNEKLELAKVNQISKTKINQISETKINNELNFYRS